ncbi:MAG: hypothetical protein KDD53_12170, partial [Bdellovibrionales bacterium]|nr:hypothetical protein [Bdellovibrionales bacterium]
VRNPRHDGCHHLLKEGATLVSSVEDVFDALPMLCQNAEPQNEKSGSDPSLTIIQRKILETLSETGTIMENELVGLFKDTPTLQSEILEMELAGQLERVPGGGIRLG